MTLSGINMRIDKLYKISFISALLIGFIFLLYGYINDYPLKVVSDIPNHLANIRELSDFSKMPGNPYFENGKGEWHYGPYFLSIALIYSLFGKNTGNFYEIYLMLIVAGSFVLIFIYSAFFSFVKNYFSKEVAIISLFILPFIMGPPFVVWAQEFSWHGIMYNIFFPNSFAIGGLFLTFWTFQKLYKDFYLKYAILALVLFFSTATSHLLVGILLYMVILLYIIQEVIKCKNYSAKHVYVFIILQASLISTLFWPYYSVRDAFNSQNIDIYYVIVISMIIFGLCSLYSYVIKFFIKHFDRVKLILSSIFYLSVIFLLVNLANDPIFYIFVFFVIILWKDKIKLSFNKITTIGLILSFYFLLIFLTSYKIDSWNKLILDMSTIQEWRWFFIFVIPGVFTSFILLFNEEYSLSIWSILGISIFFISTNSPFQISGFWKISLISIFPLTILTAYSIYKSKQKKVLIMVLLLLLLIGFVWKIDQLNDNNFSKMNTPLPYVYNISNFLPNDKKVVLSDPYTSFFIAGLTNNKVLSITPEHMDISEFDRNSEGYKIIYAFYQYPEEETTWKLLKQANVTYILINKKIFPTPKDVWGFSSQVSNPAIKTDQEIQKFENLMNYSKEKQTFKYEDKDFLLIKIRY